MSGSRITSSEATCWSLRQPPEGGQCVERRQPGRWAGDRLGTVPGDLADGGVRPLACLLVGDQIGGGRDRGVRGGAARLDCGEQVHAEVGGHFGKCSRGG
jgi:hypothetical protein